MKTINITAGLIIIFFFIFGYINYPNKKELTCHLDAGFKKLNLKGIVTNKYYTKNRRFIPVIELKSLTDTTLSTLDLYGDKAKSFNLINVLDTIYKPIHTDSIFIKRKGKLVLLGKADFGCD